jgi:hypothetical protein
VNDVGMGSRTGSAIDVSEVGFGSRTGSAIDVSEVGIGKQRTVLLSSVSQMQLPIEVIEKDIVMPHKSEPVFVIAPN